MDIKIVNKSLGHYDRYIVIGEYNLGLYMVNDLYESHLVEEKNKRIASLVW